MGVREIYRGVSAQRGIAWLNLTGLALAFLAVVVIALFVQDELRYDRFHSRSERIYRFVTDKISAQGVLETALSPAPAAAALTTDFPEIEAAARITSYSGFFSPKAVVDVGAESFLEENVLFTDSSLFAIFDFRLLRGDPQTVLDASGTAAISESLARLYFGDQDPVGRVVTIANLGEVVITGVFEEIPHNSHIKSRLLVSFDTFRSAVAGSPLEPMLDSWTPLFYYTYLVLTEGATEASVTAGLPDFLLRYHGPDGAQAFEYHLQPLADLHFHSHRIMELEQATDPAYVTIPLAVGVLVLLIAAINFTNLTTARSAQRGKEVGVRKVLGARRGGLVRQFLAEALLLSMASFVLALVAFHLLRPWLARLTEKPLALDYASNWPMVALLAGIAALTGLAAGIYPALVLSGFRPVAALSSRLTSGGSAALALRRGLVVVQLAVAVILIIGAAGGYLQLDYVQRAKLGLNEQVLVIPTGVEELAGREGAFREAVSRRPEVAAAALASGVPAGIIAGRTFSPEGQIGVQDVNFRLIAVTPEFVSTLEIELVAGRDLDRARDGDTSDAILVNRAAVAALGWDSPIGRRLEMHPRPNESLQGGSVVGVVDDFQFLPLTSATEPTMLYLTGDQLPYLYVRLAGDDLRSSLAALESVWSDFAGSTPLDFFFLEERYAQMYATERQMSRALAVFSGVAIVIGCLGLAGLAAYIAEIRSKEIGIRKILGDSVAGILTLLSREFLWLSLLANVVAWPTALILLRRWLQGFAYQVPLPWWLLPTGTVLVLAVSLLTVVLLSLRAATAHPVTSLRYE